MSVFVIAEMGSCWRFGDDHLANAYRGIRAAKEAGADAWKAQWVSDYKQLMKRRNAPDSEEWAYKYVPFPVEWLPLLKAECDRVGIEFMCTAYLPQDVAVIAPFVKRFKVAAKEAKDKELLFECFQYGKEIIRSRVGKYPTAKFGDELPNFYVGIDPHYDSRLLKDIHCVSKYPSPLDEMQLKRLRDNDYCEGYDGLSDHTAHVLTGAVAVGAGARIIESHVRLHDTPKECPDYGHSTVMYDNDMVHRYFENSYMQYVQNIRTAEAML